jgi:hypothetical protein
MTYYPSVCEVTPEDETYFDTCYQHHGFSVIDHAIFCAKDSIPYGKMTNNVGIKVEQRLRRHTIYRIDTATGIFLNRDHKPTGEYATRDYVYADFRDTHSAGNAQGTPVLFNDGNPPWDSRKALMDYIGKLEAIKAKM